MVRGVMFTSVVVVVVGGMPYRGFIWWLMWLLHGGTRCTRVGRGKGFGIKVKMLCLQKPHFGACCGI